MRVPYLNKFALVRQQAMKNNGVFLLILLVTVCSACTLYNVHCTPIACVVEPDLSGQLASRIVLPDPYFKKM